MDWIYRAMIENAGKPRLGATALALGIRPGHDIEVDGNGWVHRPLFLPGGMNGLSCAPAIDMLPVFALPVSRGGMSKKTAVWKIHVDDLGLELEAQQDAPNHISIGPARSMPFPDYALAIERTAGYWLKVP